MARTRLLPTFLRDRRGVTALEFAIVGPVFIAMLFSMIETGWLMTKIAMLDNATSQAARDIYTGNAPTQQALEEAICERATVFIDCTANISVELVEISDFGDRPSTAPDCRDSANPSYTPATSYAAANSADIMFIRVCVTTPVITPALGFGLSLPKTPTGRYQVVSSFAFMNEPF